MVTTRTYCNSLRVLIAAILLTGCCPQQSKSTPVASPQGAPQAPPGYYYKLKVRPVGAGPAWDIGEPKQIADWTLARTDSHSIRDGIVALLEKEREGADEDTIEEIAAERGLAEINKKLGDGWPGLNKERITIGQDGHQIVIPLDSPKQKYIDSLFRTLYHGVAGECYDLPHNSKLNRFFDSLRPPDSETDRLRIWEKGERARRG